MTSYKNGNNSYLLILDRGDEVNSSLTSWFKENSTQGGSISGIGALTDVTLGFYDLQTRKYHQEKFCKKYELINLSGNFSEVKGKPFVHLHAQLSDENYQCIGGHLFSATVSVTAEIYIQLHGPIPIREHCEDIGLNLITGVNNS